MSVEVLNFGCRLNAYESEVMRGLATRGGLDAIIVNTCAVTAEAEAQARQAIRKAARDNPGRPIIVTGCAAQIAPEIWGALPGVARVVGNADKLKAESWGAASHSAGESFPHPDPPPQVRERETKPSPALAGEGWVGEITNGRQTTPRTRALLQVQQGCDHRCTFCVIPYGRGASRSVPAGEVVQQARALVARGYAEIVLTGVDIASYGTYLPGAPRLGQLARLLLREVPDLKRLRLSSLDPAAIDDDHWRLIAEEPRLMPHLHLSLQHGADIILKRMKRRHLRADAVALCARARRLRPDIAFGADLIAGFPTETDSHFSEMLDLVEACGLNFLHVFPYSERPFTPAARMPQLPVPLRRERAARLREAGAQAARRFFEGRVGAIEEVLLEQPDRGHSAHFAPVRLRGATAARGDIRALRTVGCDDHGLIAEAG